MNIRLAKIADEGFVVRGQSESGVISFPKYKKTKIARKIHIQAFRKAFKNKNQKIFIAQDGENLYGFVWVIFKNSKISLERTIHIKSIWIDEKYRKKGIASALMDHLIALGNKKKFTSITALYTATNTRMAAFAASKGFQVKRILAEKKI